MTSAAVVLVNWNAWSDTIECLASMMVLARQPELIVIVDNASRDDSIARIEAWCRGGLDAEAAAGPGLPRFPLKAPTALRFAVISDTDSMPAGQPSVVVIRSATNRGFAGGNNLGIDLALAAGLDCVWLLNTDTVVDAHALQHLIDRAAQRPDAGMVGSTLIYYWKPTEVQALGGAAFDSSNGTSRHLGAYSDVRNVPADPAAVEAQMSYVVGASMLVTRAFLEAVGPMCEDYFLYYEEIDWAMRARGRFTLAYAPRSLVYHKVGGSSRKNASRLSLRYLYRNRLRLVERFYPQSRGSARRHLALQLLQNLRHGRWNDVVEITGALMTMPRVPRKRMQ